MQQSRLLTVIVPADSRCFRVSRHLESRFSKPASLPYCGKELNLSIETILARQTSGAPRASVPSNGYTKILTKIVGVAEVEEH